MRPGEAVGDEGACQTLLSDARSQAAAVNAGRVAAHEPKGVRRSAASGHASRDAPGTSLDRRAFSKRWGSRSRWGGWSWRDGSEAGGRRWVALGVVALVGVVAAEPVTGTVAGPRAGTPVASAGAEPGPGLGGRARGGRCPSSAAIDPGFFPTLPRVEIDDPNGIDPGFEILPKPPPGEIAGEAIDPGFVAPFPPCPPPGAGPEATPGTDG